MFVLFSPIYAHEDTLFPVKLFFCNFSKTNPFIATRSEEAPFRSSTALQSWISLILSQTSWYCGQNSELHFDTTYITCHSAACTRATGATDRRRRGKFCSIHVSHHLLSVFTSFSVRGACFSIFTRTSGSAGESTDAKLIYCCLLLVVFVAIRHSEVGSLRSFVVESCHLPSLNAPNRVLANHSFHGRSVGDVPCAVNLL